MSENVPSFKGLFLRQKIYRRGKVLGLLSETENASLKINNYNVRKRSLVNWTLIAQS